MATKKTASTGKKSTKKSNPVAKKTTTKVTRVDASKPAVARRSLVPKLNFSRAPLLAASVAEFVGTFILAAVVLAVSAQQIYVFFAVVAIVLAVGTMSGAHINPLVTVGAWATRRITAARGVSYLVAQVLGALLALVVLNGFISAAPQAAAEAAQFGQQTPELFVAASIPDNKEWVVLAAELLGSVLLAFGAASALRLGRDNLSAAFTYGGSVFVALLVAGTAASYVGGAAVLNPALAGALQAVKWELWPLMVYVLAPLVGGVLGFALHDLVQNERDAVVV